MQRAATEKIFSLHCPRRDFQKMSRVGKTYHYIIKSRQWYFIKLNYIVKQILEAHLSIFRKMLQLKNSISEENWIDGFSKILRETL